jgi:hypothetical protein
MAKDTAKMKDYTQFWTLSQLNSFSKLQQNARKDKIDLLVEEGLKQGGKSSSHLEVVVKQLFHLLYAKADLKSSEHSKSHKSMKLNTIEEYIWSLVKSTKSKHFDTAQAEK